jgi:hypothetical protein
VWNASLCDYETEVNALAIQRVNEMGDPLRIRGLRPISLRGSVIVDSFRWRAWNL